MISARLLSGPIGAALAALLLVSAGPAGAAAPSQVDPRDAVEFPVEDVAGPVEALDFAEASADGAVTDRGGREFILAADVLFAFDKASLTTRARAEITRIAGVLQSSSNQASKITTVTITGYTDNVGGDGYNLRLSRRRAEAVRTELANALGSAVAVTAAGRGEQDPVAGNDTARGRKANRRVEIRGR